MFLYIKCHSNIMVIHNFHSSLSLDDLLPLPTRFAPKTIK